MKRVFLALFFIMAASVPAWSLQDITDNSKTTQSQVGINDADAKASATQGQGQIQGQGQGQGQDQDQKQDATAIQGQKQATSQGNAQTINNTSNERYFVPAVTPAQSGTDNINASSPLFNAGMSATKRYKILNEQYVLLQNLRKDGAISDYEFQVEARELLALYKQETRRKKLIWIPGTQSICDNGLMNAIPLFCQ